MSRCWCVFAFLVATGVCGSEVSQDNNTTCTLSSFSKVQFNQTQELQYVEYVESIPDMTAFTLHYWIRVDEASSRACPFSYYNKDDGSSVQVVLVKSDKATGPVWRWVLQVNGFVVSIVKSPDSLVKSWHHVLHSWHSPSGTWSLYMNGQLVESGVNENLKGIKVSGGGRAFSGQRYKSINGTVPKCSYDCNDGVNGWMTLLGLDSQGIQRADYWANRLMVSVVANGCRPEHGGDVLSWKDTPRRGYGGVMEASAKPTCGNF